MTPHLPGRTPRPPEEVFAAAKAALAGCATPADLAASAAFRGGFDAFAAGAFWEAHELWEAVWARLPPASAERVLLRGLIQLANSGLKARMGRPAAASRLLDLADAALTEAARRAAAPMGLERARIAALRAEAAAVDPIQAL